MNKILLATSIAPVGLDNQKAAVQSWIESGFRVISCNIAEEIVVLKDEFPQVEFVELTRSGKELVGKPCPFIYDIMQALKERTDDVCGIVNSDIHFRHFTPDMIEYVRELANGAVVFTKRQEVGSLDDIGKQNTQSMLGVDTFFFESKQIELFDDDGMMIGQSVWDHWLPSVATKKGLSVFELMNPISFHVTHPVQWKQKITTELYLRLCKKYFPELMHGENMDFDTLVRDIHRMIAPKELSRAYLPPEMRNKSVRVFYENEKTELPEAYDYSMRIPYNQESVILSNDFLKATIWLMETYRLDVVNIITWFGSKEKELIPFDMCEHMKYCEHYVPITVCKYGKEVKGQEAIYMQICNAWFQLPAEEKFNLQRNNVEGRVFIFPAGDVGQRWKKKYSDYVEIVGFIDNFHAGETIDGVNVYPAGELSESDMYDYVVIATDRYRDELVCQARQLCAEEKIVVWKEYAV